MKYVHSLQNKSTPALLCFFPPSSSRSGARRTLVSIFYATGGEFRGGSLKAPSKWKHMFQPNRRSRRSGRDGEDMWSHGLSCYTCFFSCSYTRPTCRMCKTWPLERRRATTQHFSRNGFSTNWWRGSFSKVHCNQFKEPTVKSDILFNTKIILNEFYPLHRQQPTKPNNFSQRRVKVRFFLQGKKRALPRPRPLQTR